MRTKERLAKALREAGASWKMVNAALDGQYDDFESDSATPIGDLVRDCTLAGLKDLAGRAKRGEFDGTREEGDAWFKREGRKLL